MSRSKNSLRNIATSMAGQLLNNLLKFICRTAFIYTLGKQYLGISSLYANVLTLLNISELGFSTAVTYSLYKPLAEDDKPRICALMNFFKKVYRVVGFVIFGIGLCLIPVLPRLMTGVTDKINIYLYYFLYLVQTAVSYLFFAYKAVLLTADQKKYLVDLVQYVTQIVMNGVQILSLFLFHSFFVYTVLAVVFTVIQNIATSVLVDKKYPYLKEGAGQRLNPAERKTIFGRVYAAALYKISSAVGTATDQLIISSFLGVVLVGIYDNYYLIIQVFQQILNGGMRAFSASLGNYYVKESRERNEFMFRVLNLVNNIAVVFCSVCFLNLFQPFIRIWIGKGFLLGNDVLWIIVYNFATNYMELVVNIYNESSGTFVRGKYRAVCTAVANLVISLILVRYLGLSGVFLGSIISRMGTIWWYDAYILYHYGFQTSPVRYFFSYFVNVALIAVIGGGILFLTRPLDGGSDLLLILIRLVLCIVLTAGIYWILYHRSEEYHYLKTKGKELLRRRKRD